jgi:ornithine cyclodeaminase/alanine dehydrogenase-like protein (mu-crystallin family)
MTLIFNNDDVRRALNLNECLEVMEEAYREQAAGRAVNRPTCHSYLAHSLPGSTYSFKSVDGATRKNVTTAKKTSGGPRRVVQK